MPVMTMLTPEPNETPTAYAIRLLAEGYTPEEVEKRMREEKIFFPNINSTLNELLGKKGKSVEILADMVGVSASYLYQVMKGTHKRATRNLLLRIAFVLELTINETQILLKSGNCAPLSGVRPRDVHIMYGITNGLPYDEVNQMLSDDGMLDLNARG